MPLYTPYINRSLHGICRLHFRRVLATFLPGGLISGDATLKRLGGTLAPLGIPKHMFVLGYRVYRRCKMSCVHSKTPSRRGKSAPPLDTCVVLHGLTCDLSL